MSIWSDILFGWMLHTNWYRINIAVTIPHFMAIFCFVFRSCDVFCLGEWWWWTWWYDGDGKGRGAFLCLALQYKTSLTLVRFFNPGLDFLPTRASTESLDCGCTIICFTNKDSDCKQFSSQDSTADEQEDEDVDIRYAQTNQTQPRARNCSLLHL